MPAPDSSPAHRRPLTEEEAKQIVASPYEAWWGEPLINEAWQIAERHNLRRIGHRPSAARSGGSVIVAVLCTALGIFFGAAVAIWVLA